MGTTPAPLQATLVAMALRSDHLVLRPPTPDDAPVVTAAVHASRADLLPFMPWANGTYTEADALRWINGELGDAQRFVMIDDDGTFVGSCGLNRINEVNNTANLGYWVHSDHTGRGHATAATRLLAHHGLVEMGYQRIEVFMSTRNHASRRVAEKAGAHYEGVARARLLLHGEPHDADVFSFTAVNVGSDGR